MSEGKSTTEDGYRRVHRLTPLLRFWSLILALLAILVVNVNADALRSAVAIFSGENRKEAIWDLFLGVGAFVLVCLALWFLSGLWWRRTGYRLGEEELEFRHGLISRQLRVARYDRTQAVDVVEPVIARLFRLAAVRVETAGGAASSIEIAYLRKADAEELCSAVLSRVRREQGPAGTVAAPRAGAQIPAPDSAPGAGVGEAAAADAEAGTPANAPAAGGVTVIPEIPIGRSLAVGILRPGPLLTTALAVAALLIPGLGIGVIALLFGAVSATWGIIDSAWRYTAVLGENQGNRVLLINYGLADRRRQTIRFDRIHGVQIRQGLLLRPFGWYEVSVSVAGYGLGSGSGSTCILPVGTREQAMELASLVSGLSAEECEEFLSPEGAKSPTYTSPRRAKWVSPIDYRRQSVTLHGGRTIVHVGRFSRRVMFIENPHIQELAYKSGLLGHWLGLATIKLHLVSGPVSMAAQDLDLADARELFGRLVARPLPALQPREDAAGPGELA